MACPKWLHVIMSGAVIGAFPAAVVIVVPVMVVVMVPIVVPVAVLVDSRPLALRAAFVSIVPLPTTSPHRHVAGRRS
jgi:hypothetical protein